MASLVPKTNKALILSPISSAVLGKAMEEERVGCAVNVDYALTFLKDHLSAKDSKTLVKDIRRPFILAKNKQISKKKHHGRTPTKLNRLSVRKKKDLGLLKIGSKSLKFADFIAVNQCWTDYILKLLKVSHLESEDLMRFQHENLEEMSAELWKADFHGAFLRVTASKCPVFIGLEGFVVFETKNTYKLLGRDNVTRCIPKQPCKFAVKLGPYELAFVGKNMFVKPNERSNKKVKNFSFKEILC